MVPAESMTLERAAALRAPYLPFAQGAFRLGMGLMPLSEAAWFEIDAAMAAELAEKRALLAERHGEVFAALPAADEPAAELLALVVPHLLRHHADVFSGDAARIGNRITGEDWDLAPPDLHPLDLCGRLLQEDFAILVPTGPDYLLAGASLAAPARWRLAEKIGRPLATLHAPVPGYAAALARPVDRFFAHLKPGRLVWRVNWGVVDHPARFQPVPRHGSEPITAARAGELLWLRVERQTLRKLARTEAVVFTIRTHITRLDRAIETAEAAGALLETIRTMPAEMQRYKQIAPFAPALLAWLDARLRA